MREMFQQSRETAAIADLLRQAAIDVPISFEVASQALGFKLYSSLAAYTSARNIVRREGIVIEGVHGFGFKRLTAVATVDRGDRHLQGIRRRARKMATEISGAIRQNLPRAAMLKATEMISRAGVIQASAAPYRSNRTVVDEPVEVVKSNSTDGLAAFRSSRERTT